MKMERDGGAGNPGGYIKEFAYSGCKGSNGTGGLLVIYANKFENLGMISADGSAGANGYYSGSCGGGSGGGSINIFTTENLSSESGKMSCNGGSGGKSSYGGPNGGNGGNGSITVTVIPEINR